MNTAAGYTCASCGLWVYQGSYHSCSGVGVAGPAPVFTMGQCRAPWMPLTPDAIRLIIREELERALKPKPDTSTGEQS